MSESVKEAAERLLPVYRDYLNQGNRGGFHTTLRLHRFINDTLSRTESYNFMDSVQQYMQSLLDEPTFQTFQESEWFKAHSRHGAPQNEFHKSVDYPDDADRVMLVTGWVHDMVGTHLQNTNNGLRKRLCMNPLSLEVYENRTRIAVIPYREWSREMHSAVINECNEWMNEYDRRPLV